MKRILLVAMILLAGSLANAQESETGTTRGYSSTSSSSAYLPHVGWAGYLGFNAGYTNYNPNLQVEGAPSSVKAMASYVTKDTSGVFDLGYGVQSQTYSNDTVSNNDFSTGVMELASRYQFSNRWQLGAVYNQFFNKGENYGANQADAEFAGIQVLREFGFANNYLGRIGARVMTSLNVNNESVNMAMIDFQLGWGGSSRPASTTAGF